MVRVERQKGDQVHIGAPLDVGATKGTPLWVELTFEQS